MDEVLEDLEFGYNLESSATSAPDGSSELSELTEFLEVQALTNV
jgi:hypothetical protein